MKSAHELIAEGKALLDKLAATGQHPGIARKLDHLVNKPYPLHGGELLKLERLIAEASA